MQFPILPFDACIGWIMFVMLLAELILSVYAISNMIKDRTARYSGTYTTAAAGVFARCSVLILLVYAPRHFVLLMSGSDFALQ